MVLVWGGGGRGALRMQSALSIPPLSHRKNRRRFVSSLHKAIFQPFEAALMYVK